MSSDLAGITNELQVSHFGFSALSFNDSIHNLMVDTWIDVCENEFKNSLKDLPAESKRRFTTYPFRDTNLTSAFENVKKYLVTELFEIPTSATLPEFREMRTAYAATIGQSNKDPKSLEKQFSEKLEKVRLLRQKLGKLNHDKEELEKCTDALRMIEKGQKELISVRSKTPDAQN